MKAQQKRERRINELRAKRMDAAKQDRFAPDFDGHDSPRLAAFRNSAEAVELAALEKKQAFANRQRVLSIEPKSAGKNYGQDKELITRYTVIVRETPTQDYQRKNGGMRCIIEARVYMGRSKSASAVYASIWIHGKNVDASGTGTAYGNGYHKASAALSSAIRSAGVKLNNSISGAGDSAMEEALRAIARKLGHKTCLVMS